MKIIKEQKLNESAKEELRVSFLTDFISDGWTRVGVLQSSIEALKETYKGVSPIADLLQSLIDAYLVCIGQMEAHIEDKKYIEFPEDSKLAEALTEDVDIHIEGNEVHIADDSGEEVAIIPVEPEGEVAPEEKSEEDEEEKPAEEAPIEEEPIEEPIEVPAEKPENAGVFDFFVDFDEPVGEPATDADIYGDNGN